MHKRYCVRVICFRNELHRLDPMWAEQMRYMGYLNRVIDDDEKEGYDFLCPNSISNSNSISWAESNAMRMQSFGINAVAAPEWK